MLNFDTRIAPFFELPQFCKNSQSGLPSCLFIFVRAFCAYVRLCKHAPLCPSALVSIKKSPRYYSQGRKYSAVPPLFLPFPGSSLLPFTQTYGETYFLCSASQLRCEIRPRTEPGSVSSRAASSLAEIRFLLCTVIAFAEKYCIEKCRKSQCFGTINQSHDRS